MTLPKTTAAPAPTESTPKPPSSGPPLEGTGDRILALIKGTYATLNLTRPDKTKECWLCLTPQPPYYEGLAVVGKYTNQATAEALCGTAMQHKLTISEVSGKGLCIGKVPATHQGLCNATEPLPQSGRYLIAPNGTYWACNTGLTPCVSTTVLDTTVDYCVLIELWPKVIYHPSDYDLIRTGRSKREPISITTAILLGGLTMGGIAAGIGTGTVALQETKQFQLLQQVMCADVRSLEESVAALEKSLSSLAEVALQNRRGLDLLFLQQGGICAALKEECCFYADHTGVVRDNLAKIKERRQKYHQLIESQQGWFQNWYNRSPWYSTLISTIMGPLIIIFLILMFGPCILNRLIQFIKERLSVVQSLVLTQQYQQLKQRDLEMAETPE